MSNKSVIKVEHVSKKYCRSLKHTMAYGIQDIAMNSLGLSAHSERLRGNEFWALDDVSFDVRRGETLGIIGTNGSGKTTLLKLVTGIMLPDKGRIEVAGRVGALIEVGAGFHPLLTGRENIYVNGAILGMSKKEIDRKFDEIVAFADIGDLIDAPVKHYSTGMYVKLGFAVAIHCDPDILLIDEVLAVGDEHFQRRCLSKISELQEDGKAIVYVSHALTTVEGLCTKVLWIDTGRARQQGVPEQVIHEYLLTVGTFRSDGKRIGRRWGTKAAEIVSMELYNGNWEQIDGVSSRDEALIVMNVRFNEQVRNPIFGIIIKNDLGAVAYGINSRWLHMDFDGFSEGEQVKVVFKQHMDLTSGSYHVDAAVAYADGMTFCDWQEKALEFGVELPGQTIGIANLDSKISVIKLRHIVEP